MYQYIYSAPTKAKRKKNYNNDKTSKLFPDKGKICIVQETHAS